MTWKKQKQQQKRIVRPDLVYTVTEEAHQVESKRRLEALQLAEKKRNSLDVAFVMDVSYSMQPYIGHLFHCLSHSADFLFSISDAARKYIDDISQKVREQYPHIECFRFAFVGYRDWADEVRLEVFDFTENVEDLKEKIKTVVAKGGDDDCEDVYSRKFENDCVYSLPSSILQVLGGLSTAADALAWSSGNRVMLHILGLCCSISGPFVPSPFMSLSVNQ